MSYYEILNLNKNCNQADIKKAYHKKSLITHPDKTRGKTTEEIKRLQEEFIQISKAYDILINAESRKLYDEKGENGLTEYKKQKEKERQVNEARERNIRRKEEKRKKLQEKEELELLNEKLKKEKELEEKRKKLITKQENERQIALKRQKEIEEEVQKKLDEEKSKITQKNVKIENKKMCFKYHLCQLITPFRCIILQIDHIEISDVNSYIITHIINKTVDNIIDFENQTIKKLYLRLKEISDYFDNDYYDVITKKNIRGRLMMKRFINLCEEYNIDKYIYEEYEQYLKNKNLYDKENFLFLKSITNTYINIIEHIVPDIYFL
jgi:hypothetical protein